MNKVIKIGDAITSIGSLRGLAEGAQMFMDSANSEATKRAYQSDWARFTRFCEDHKISPMPAPRTPFAPTSPIWPNPG